MSSLIFKAEHGSTSHASRERIDSCPEEKKKHNNNGKKLLVLSFVGKNEPRKSLKEKRKYISLTLKAKSFHPWDRNESNLVGDNRMDQNRVASLTVSIDAKKCIPPLQRYCIIRKFIRKKETFYQVYCARLSRPSLKHLKHDALASRKVPFFFFPALDSFLIWLAPNCNIAGQSYADLWWAGESIDH